MQASASPRKLSLPFADSGAKTDIPTASQVGVTPGAASLIDGFPPATRTPLAAGGVPPFGQDMNGILYLATAWARWQAAGGPIFFDSTFATAIGGYPKGAIVQSSTVPGRLWVNGVENNATNPDSSGNPGWLDLTGGGGTIAGNGWQRLPGGLIIQWGSAGTTTGQQNAVMLPAAFPKNHFITIVGEQNAVGWESGGTIQPRWFGVVNRTLQGFSVTAAILTGGGVVQFAGGTGFHYYSIGN